MDHHIASVNIFNFQRNEYQVLWIEKESRRKDIESFKILNLQVFIREPSLFQNCF